MLWKIKFGGLIEKPFCGYDPPLSPKKYFFLECFLVGKPEELKQVKLTLKSCSDAYGINRRAYGVKNTLIFNFK